VSPESEPEKTDEDEGGEAHGAAVAAEPFGPCLGEFGLDEVVVETVCN
jgi:hypothetical protein